MSEDVKQRIQYLIEHGGLWEQARDKSERMHRVTLVLVSLALAAHVAETIVRLLH